MENPNVNIKIVPISSFCLRKLRRTIDFDCAFIQKCKQNINLHDYKYANFLALIKIGQVSLPHKFSTICFFVNCDRVGIINVFGMMQAFHQYFLQSIMKRIENYTCKSENGNEKQI